MINPQAGVMGMAPGLAQLMAKYGAALQPRAPGLGAALMGQGYQMPALRSAMGQVAGPAPIPAQAAIPAAAGGYQPQMGTAGYSPYVGTAANPAPASIGGKANGLEVPVMPNGTAAPMWAWGPSEF